MTDKPWKVTERAVARIMGGARVPVTGRGRGSAPDIAHPLWALEVKHRASIPLWLREALAQAKASVRGQQVPVVVIHRAGARHADDLVLLRLADFQALYGTLPTGAGEGTDG